MLKNIRFKGRYFANETNLELFQDNDRMSLIYGKNGSGKSTLSNAILKAIGRNIEGIEYATLFSEDGTIYSENECVHVFNEDYVNEKVRLKEDGLNTIVLLGELGNLENKIFDLQLKKEAENKHNEELKIKYEEYDDINNPKSPKYCRLQINLGLSGETHWADREKQIKDGKRNASVTESIIDNIVKWTSKESRGIIQERFDKNIHLLKEVRKNEAVQLKNTVALKLNYNEENLRTLLKQKVERPNLSEREENLLRMVEDGKVEQVNEIKKIFSKEKTTKCPFCFQEITYEYKEDLVQSIRKVLSKEFDEHQENLRKCIIPDPEVDFGDLEVISTKYVLNCKSKIEEIKNEIFKIREVVLKKINHPYTPIVDFKSNLIDKLEEYEEVRIKLQSEVDKYNNAVEKIETLSKSLSDIVNISLHFFLKDV